MPAREVRFVDVGFTYPSGGRPVYEHLDLTIPAGRSLAIVGRNGAGKTTLVKLLCRLYDPTSGSITVDGHDLRDIDVEAWRERVAVVFQDFVRFELSLRRNLVPDGRPVPDDDLLGALEVAGAAGLADLDQVLSKAYPGGTDLSGGQWQRVALARALTAVRLGAGMVVLDEPTAQLDVRGEAAIFERLLAATGGLTTLLISHRFSTVRRADRIAVVEGGVVVEQGSHDELMAAAGRYREMFELQASRFAQDLDHVDSTTSISTTARRGPRRRPRRRGGRDRDDQLPDLPGRGRSLTHLLRLGFRLQPALLWIALGVTVLGAVPDGLFALWLGMLARAFRTPADPDRVLLVVARVRARRLGGRRVGAARRQRPDPAAVPAAPGHRPRDPRRPAPGHHRRHRAARAAGGARPAGHAARTRSSRSTTSSCRSSPRSASPCASAW